MKDKIVKLLEKHSEGLIIEEISRLLKHHRTTVTKYIFELKGEEKIKIRQVGRAKIIYLKKVEKK